MAKHIGLLSERELKKGNHPIQCVLPSQSILPNFAGKNSDYV